jgi:hypothetical protein
MPIVVKDSLPMPPWDWWWWHLSFAHRLQDVCVPLKKKLIISSVIIMFTIIFLLVYGRK